ncbi:MAG TPA: hypothetical protein ENJ80_02000 [Gammaproteobacteria bacterium]|nr:hypothetical protein [Gammaproteobacteria bacterium]
MNPIDGKQIQAQLFSWLEQCLLRRAPQDDPLSWRRLQWALLAYIALDLAQARAGSDWTASLGMTLLDTLILILFSWSVLRVTGKTARYPQILTALAGTGLILGFVGLPLILRAAQLHADAGPDPGLLLGWLLLLGWSIAVQAHIYRHALSASYGAGLLVAGLQTVLAISLLETLFPRAAG